MVHHAPVLLTPQHISHGHRIPAALDAILQGPTLGKEPLGHRVSSANQIFRLLF